MPTPLPSPALSPALLPVLPPRPHLPAACLIAIVGVPGPARESLARALRQALSDQLGDVGWMDDSAALATADAEPGSTGLAMAMQQHAVWVVEGNALVLGHAEHMDDAARAAHAGNGRSQRPSSQPPIPIELCLLVAPPAADLPADGALRLALLQSGLPFSVIAGPPETRLPAALSAWHALQRTRMAKTRPPTRWRHVCGRCGDGDCERQMFDQLHTAR